LLDFGQVHGGVKKSCRKCLHRSTNAATVQLMR
jgi:hypothetical protein